MHAVILIGVPAAGKTTFFRERFAGTHVRVSLDDTGSRAREWKLVAGCLAAGRPFVVDNTNVLAAQRAVYLRAARAAGYRVTGYYFPVERKTAIARNARREAGKVPVPAILRALKRLEPPALEEGFDELFTAA
jgi:predicted kinase